MSGSKAKIIVEILRQSSVLATFPQRMDSAIRGIYPCIM